MNLFLTGATGFLGRRLATALNTTFDGTLTVAVRRPVKVPAAHIVEVKGIDATTDWSDVLKGQQVIIHAAARAHIMKDKKSDPLAEYRRVNVDGTLNLARQAAAAGVKRFIFISSIKVNGEQTLLGQPFTAEDTPSPENAYGISKWEAEKGLMQISAETGLEVVIIRPPLVYGPDVKANFTDMIKMVGRGIPLPVGSINNKRSLIAVDNLVDLIITCIDHPAAANQVFLAGDGEDISTADLLRVVARAMGKPLRLMPVPSIVLQLAATVFGKKALAQRLLGSLQVDVSKARELLGWTPPISVEEGVSRCFESSTEKDAHQ